MGWSSEQLGDHDRTEFTCGEESLDRFLREQAGQYARRDLGRTYVAVRPGERRVTGYYTLAASSIQHTLVPGKRLPKHSVPVVLLGRLAVDQSVQGQGLGRSLLADALRRVLATAAVLGIHGVTVHALNDVAGAFYRRYGFVSIAGTPPTLFLPTATIRRAQETE